METVTVFVVTSAELVGYKSSSFLRQKMEMYCRNIHLQVQLHNFNMDKHTV